MKKVIYPGTFDPVTNGHIDLIERACRIFDFAYVALAVDLEQRPLFTLEERKTLLEAATAKFKNLKVVTFEGLLVDFAKKNGITGIIRGLRAISDFDYEFQMALTNRRMAPKIETIFMMPSENYSYLSASLVREIARLGGNLEGLVPRAVVEMFKKKLGKSK